LGLHHENREITSVFLRDLIDDGRIYGRSVNLQDVELACFVRPSSRSSQERPGSGLLANLQQYYFSLRSVYQRARGAKGRPDIAKRVGHQ
jgi:hypothetical protein